MTFSDGSAIRLTVAKYYTPTGRSIQKPYDEGREEYYNDISYRFLHGEFENEDSISFSDSLKYITPGGRVVYGGGGIMPDIFVPVDTTFYSPLLSRVTNLGLAHRFAFQYTDLHRAELEAMTTPSEITGYLDDQELMKEFIGYASSKNVQVDQEDLAVSGDYLLTQIKAYIARNILDNEGFYPIIRAVDYTLNVAIDTLSAI
jgi:carboxyl-terminal processing protease